MIQKLYADAKLIQMDLRISLQLVLTKPFCNPYFNKFPTISSETAEVDGLLKWIQNYLCNAL